MSPDSLVKLRTNARAVFDAALKTVDAKSATLRFVNLHKGKVNIGNTTVEDNKPIYVVSIGKAAVGMAQALNEIIGHRIVAGICVCPKETNVGLTDAWRVFCGGHPLPDEESLKAANTAFRLLARAHTEQVIVIFAISGGGSAMIESPIAEDISLPDLQTANRLLVSCGATIAEINTIRRTFSAVKGGKLLAGAPNARAITLIISDTNEGDEASVASGPTIVPSTSIVSARELVSRYSLEAKLPESILRAINGSPPPPQNASSPYYVIASNRTALDAAKAKAEQLGFQPRILEDVSEQPIAEGCERLLAVLENQPGNVCLISGGEFSCPVRGEGVGGRNSETALRCAMSLNPDQQTVVLSAGTDGIDGNSPAAGAIADGTTMGRAGSLGIDAHDFLSRSDSHTFFAKLGDAIFTGPTGTNVRDVRVLLSLRARG